MKTALACLMAIVFALFTVGCAESPVEGENLAYRNEIVEFVNEHEQELLDSVREVEEYGLPEYASAPFTSEKVFERVFIRHTDYSSPDMHTGATFKGITEDYEGLYVYLEGEDCLTTYDMPVTESLFESGMIKYIDVYEDGDVAFYMTYTNGSWGPGLYYQILYTQDGEQLSEANGWQSADGGWYRIDDSSSHYVYQMTECLYYDFTIY